MKMQNSSRVWLTIIFTLEKVVCQLSFFFSSFTFVFCFLEWKDTCLPVYTDALWSGIVLITIMCHSVTKFGSEKLFKKMQFKQAIPKLTPFLHRVVYGLVLRSPSATVNQRDHDEARVVHFELSLRPISTNDLANS